MVTFTRWCLCVVALLIAAVPAALADEPGGRLILRGQIDLATSGTHSDVWGWVHPGNGREYAIVGQPSLGSVWIVDVTNPANPVVKSTITASPGFDIKTWDKYLYLVDGDGRRFDGRIYDIINPTAPVRVGTFLSAHNIFIDDRGFMYNETTGLTILDLVNPKVPFTLWVGGNEGHDATVVGNVLYDFHGTTGTNIYDVTNPANPTLLGAISGIDDNDMRYHHSGWPSADGTTLYINDELAISPQPDIMVYDISDVANPTLIDSHNDPGASVHNSYRVGDFLFVSYYTAGVQVFDISNRNTMRPVTGFDTSAKSGELKFEGAWGVYPFAPSGNVYVSDTDNGLFVFEFDQTVAVVIAGFEARYQQGAVQLSWQIVSADGLSGYHIYRADNDREFVRLNPTLLPVDQGSVFEDRTVGTGRTYQYRIGAVDSDGEFTSPVRTVTVPRGMVTLAQNTPNPFNPTTAISYTLPAASEVSLVVYTASGHTVRTLVDTSQPAGVHNVTWDGKNDAGAAASSGIYFYQITAGRDTQSRRMVLLK